MSRLIEMSQAKQIDDTHIEVDGIVYSLCDHKSPFCQCDRTHESVGMTREDFERLTLDEQIEKVTGTDKYKQIMKNVELEIEKSKNFKN